MSTSTRSKHVPHVVIVGAGFAGLATAIALKRKLGFLNFTIYERADAIGGTWRDSTYPGCTSDTPGHWYSLSTDLNPYWNFYYPTQPEIRDYLEGVWHKNNLEQHTVLNTNVVESVWSNEAQQYSIIIENATTKERKAVQAEVIFYALGGFQSPLYPKEVKGLETFKGALFHSARWRHDVSLQGKRVGVIGNGCSAAQFIPEISQDPSVEVINFCRTPQWYVDRGDFKYSKFMQNMFVYVPFLMRLYRNFLMLKSDLVSLIFRKSNKRIISIAKKFFESYIRNTAPQKYLERLIPNYAPGCKRIIVDPGYLASLHRPNVTLRWDTIDSVVPNGIKLKTGEVIPLDVIIFGTGFSLEPRTLHVAGSQGYTMHEYFKRKGGPIAYLGTCIPGFPNMFVFPGPNAATGHASLIFTEEVQIGYATTIIRPVLEGKARSFEITEEATNEYNEWLQGRLNDTVWTDCASYYRLQRDGQSRVVANFPGSGTLFWWLCQKPDWGLFHAVGAEEFERERKTKSNLIRWCSISIFVALAATFLSYK